MPAPGAASPSGRTRLTLRWIPAALLVLGLAATGIGYALVARTIEADARTRFENEADRVLLALSRRIDTYIAILESGASLFAVEPDLDLEEFRAYVGRLQLHTAYSGIQGMGYAMRRPIPAAGPRGAPAAGSPEDSFTIVYLEPLDERNRAAIGYDMFAEPTRRAAMSCARDTGEPCASGPVTLKQEIDADKQVGFLIYVPVFQRGTPDTVAERRDGIVGFVYAPFRSGDLLAAVLAGDRNRHVDLELFDGRNPSQWVRLAGTRRVAADDADDAAPQTVRTLNVAGRPWSVRFTPRAPLTSGTTAGQAVALLVSGLSVTLLVAGLAWAQLRAREADDRAMSLERRQSAGRAVILESITDAFYALDREWRYTYVNRRALDYYGKRAEELLGRAIWDVFPGLIGTVWEERFRQAVDERRTMTFEARSPITSRWIEVHAYPSDEGLAVYFQDVTARLESDTAIARLNRDLQERVDEFQTLLSVLPVGIGVALDPACRDIRTNRAFAELLRLPPGQNASLTATEENRPTHFRVLQDGVELAPDQLPLQVAAREGKSITGLELEVAFDDGSTLRLLEYAAPLFDDQGRTRGSVGAFVDVTARAAAEETFRTMADSAPVLVWMADASRALVWFNEPWLRFTGRTMAQETGSGWLDGVHPEDAYRCQATYVNAFDRREPFSMEFRLRRADGAWRWVLNHGVPLSRGASFTGYIGSCIDITERKVTELENARLLMEVREADRLKDEFLATLSHELRTPLNAILGWTRMLRTASLPEEGARRALEIIERNAGVQAQLVEEVLDMSRIVTGKLRLEVQPLDPAEVVTAAADAVRPAADAKGVQLDVECDREAGPILGDADRLQQAVWNLLSNAIKFTPRGGRVQALLQQADSHVEIVVRDTGVGITPDFLPFLFDRFRQADGGTTRSMSGLGLGLSIVKHVVEAHGGTVDASSDGIDRGSTFRLRLPRPADSGVETPGTVDESREGRRAFHASPPEPVNGRQLTGTRVLAVDDDPDGLSLLSTVLARAGATVTAVRSGAGALEALDRQVPDVIVTDVGMPGMDGFELLQRIRERPSEAGGRVPAAVLTAYARSEDRLRSLRDGFEVHLSKPVDPDELVAAIASLAHRT